MKRDIIEFEPYIQFRSFVIHQIFTHKCCIQMGSSRWHVFPLNFVNISNIFTIIIIVIITIVIAIAIIIITFNITVDITEITVFLRMCPTLSESSGYMNK